MRNFKSYQKLDLPRWNGVVRGFGIVAVILVLWSGYIWLGQPVTLVIDDQIYPLRVHQRTAEALLTELDVTLAPEDSMIVSNIKGKVQTLETDLHQGDRINIRLAQPVIIEADGQTVRRLTHQKTAAAVLEETDIKLGPYDKISMNGAFVSPQSTLPQRQIQASAAQRVANLLSTARIPRQAIASIRPAPVTLTVQRAIPVRLIDDRLSNTFYATQATVGAALAAQNITLFPGDQIFPQAETRLTPNMHIYIQRSIPLTIIVDGQSLQTRTRQETVGEVLAQVGVVLMGQDYSRPALDQPVLADDVIEIVRVRETIEIEQDLIPFESRWVPDETMEIDRQEVRQVGATGVVKTRTRVRYENEQEVWREIEDEWLDQASSDRVVAYGTNIVVRTVNTPAGPLEYWRRVPMLVTAYNPASSGKAPDHPRYGLTRSGLEAGFGRVAVDPKVVPLLTNLYVPEYGPAIAADTGGRILGKHLDLGYDDDQPLPILYEWRDIYVLTPIPPADQIRYVLPQWPQR